MAEHVAAVKDGKLDYSYTDSSKKQSQATGSNLGYPYFIMCGNAVSGPVGTYK